MNYFELKKNLVKKFEEADIDELADIDWIIVEITGQKRSLLPLIRSFSDEELEKIYDAISKRLKHIPIGIIFGKSYFYGREFFVSNDTLIPRLDTEILIDEFLKVTKDLKSKTVSDNFTPTVLDVGTGSGAIAVTIQKETNFDVCAVDISEKALEIAKKNALNLGAKVDFIHSNLFENIKDLKVDFIVSNPPYIKSDVVLTLDKEVKDNEPILALDGGTDGLDFYRKITLEAKNHLNENGMLFFEIGFDQAKEVSELMQADFENITVIKDYGNNDRVVYGKLRRI